VFFQIDISGLAAVNNTVFQHLCSCCRALTEVVVRSCSYLGDDGVKAIVGDGEELPRIEHIDLSGCILVGSAIT
jgi:hypothetical protein